MVFDLFSASEPSLLRPLAVRMRPKKLQEVIGQDHALAAGSPLSRLAQPVSKADRNAPSAVILFGPPGVGKTTIAHIIAHASGRNFEELSAVTSGVKEIRAVMQRAREAMITQGVETILFIDEVHRFSKTQQDALLPSVENRDVTFIAATTENPSFSIISPLLSRSVVVKLNALHNDHIAQVLDRAVHAQSGLNDSVVLQDSGSDALVRLSGGDARKALSMLEAAAGAVLDSGDMQSASSQQNSVTPNAREQIQSKQHSSEQNSSEPNANEQDLSEQTSSNQTDSSAYVEEARYNTYNSVIDSASNAYENDSVSHVPSIDDTVVASVAEQALVRYDRDGDDHYDVASAFIKSMRGSDVDAALHYLARMIRAGEDPRFIARRIIIAASEEVGMAAPQVLGVCVSAAQAVEMIGMPEARIILAQAVVAVATAPKSNASYMGIAKALADVDHGDIGHVPLHLRNAPTALMKQWGHHEGYQYAHDAPNAIANQQYMPDSLVGRTYYEPSDRGYEKQIQGRLTTIRSILHQSSDAKQANK